MALTTRFFKIMAKSKRVFSISSIRERKVVPFKLTDIGEGIREVTVKEWFVKPGDKVAQFDNICEVQSDKASVTITSRYDGCIKTLCYEVNEVALVGKPLLDIEVEDDNPEIISNEDIIESSNQLVTPIPENNHNRVLTTPAVRRLAAENGINLVDVPASRKDGRIIKEDVLAFLDKQKPITGKTEIDLKSIPTDKIKLESEIIPLEGYQQHMWKTMTQSLTIPHLVYCDEFDVTKLIEFRTSVKECLMVQGISISFLPFFIKATSKALDKCPKLNAWLDEDTQTIKVIKNHNISIAMDTPNGLIVPNIKNVQNLSITEIAIKLNELQKLSKKTSFAPADLSGGTLTLSNIGSIGGTYTKPVILPPQVFIGAIGRVQKLPRFNNNNEVIASNVLTVSWAADHRVVDGASVARFSNLWKEYIENPWQLTI